jgi:hypothetical protein
VGFFDFLRSKRISAVPPAPLLTEAEIFSHPVYLALWVNRYFLQNHPVENNYELLPDEETRESLGITFAQRERCALEYSILRIAGVSWLIKWSYDDVFWLTFSKNIIGPLAKHLFGEDWRGHVTDTAEALDRYVVLSAAGNLDECAQFYLTRLYDDNGKFLQLKMAGIGFIACDQINSAFEIMRDAHTTVTLR